MKTALTFCAALIAAALAPDVHAVDLTVEVLNPKTGEGAINAALYAGADGWLKPQQAVGAQRTQVGDKTVLVYRNLAAGRYAVSLFHDENGNGKLDTNVVGLPTERYGFSRDARGKMGPPAFDDAAVDLQADTTIRITLK